MESKPDKYLTIGEPSTGLYKDKGSKFHSFAYPVKSEKEVKDIVDKLRKEYYDARHHCFAYRLGPDKNNFRAFDDGEPSGTAGKPILGQIDSHNLTNIVIVVVRYFGGILLGTGGLIQAYRAAAADAITNSKIIERTQQKIYSMEFDYLYINQVMKVIKDFNLECFNQKFDTSCSLKVKINKGNLDNILPKFSSINNLHITFVCDE